MTPGDAKQRYLWALVDDLELTREDRHELAEHVLNRDVHSWATLDEHEIDRMIDTLMGYVRVRALMIAKGRTNVR